MHLTTSCVGLAGALLLAGVSTAAHAQAAPLPSWRPGAVKTAIESFVTRATQRGGPGYIAPADRIAVFDNDGTLWCEHPMYTQLAFALDRARELAAARPELARTEPFRTLLSGDPGAIARAGEKGVAELMAATHAGTTTEEFSEAVRRWFARARHPAFDRPYSACVYQPMLELLAYLRENGFTTFIVSGGGADFLRVVAESTYGIPPERVIGSSGKVTLESRGGVPVLVKQPQVDFVDDGPGKPVGIHRHIGRRPAMAFGNSDGDLQMLQWTAAGAGPRFCLLVHHTDGEREAAYDRTSHVGRLDVALDEARARGWTVVDMRRDWQVVFPPP